MESAMAFPREIAKNGIATGFDSIEHFRHEVYVLAVNDDFDFFHRVKLDGTHNVLALLNLMDYGNVQKSLPSKAAAVLSRGAYA